MPLFFVHIPKTAGTSFRLGAEDFFGDDRIVYDYGKGSNVTAPLVRAALYENVSDFWSFRRACEQQAAAMVGGHVNASRFVSLFGTGQTITFLRDPLQRMASEYAHSVRHLNYKGSFRDFYTQPAMHNRQSKVLSGVEVEAIGFLGLTERYADSIEMLNRHFGIGIPPRKDNRGKRSLDSVHRLSAEETAELKKLNERDIALYQRATALFEARYGLFREGHPGPDARRVERQPQRVGGWARWAAERDAPVGVEVWINGKAVEQVGAVSPRPNLCRLLPPRGGYVGFQLPVKLAPGD